jgi:protein ImuB
MARIACLWVPDLPLCAAIRAEPQLAGAPLAVVQAGDLGGRAHVLCATPLAEGVAPGQTLAEARAVCPQLVHRSASPERERAAAQAALEAAGAVSPRFEEAAPGVVHVDAAGLSKLFGDDRGIARALVAAAERVGLRAAVGIAAGKSFALLAARAAAPDLTFEVTRHGLGGGAFRVVAPAEQAAFLAGLPLIALDLSDELQETLRRFGLQTLGDVSRLPPGPLAARLGPEGAVLWRLTRGEDATALAPRPAPERFEEGEELDWDAQSIEPLLFVWKALLGRLEQRLRSRGLMARELLLRLRLADASWDERAIDLAAPAREVAPLLQLLRLLVEGRPPAAGVTAVRLCAVPVPEVLDQLPLFGPRGASPCQLAAAVGRLCALMGPGRVGQPVAPDRWTPFAAEVTRFAPPPPPRVPQAPPPADLTLAARALRPPRTAEVRCDASGTPLLVIGEGALGGRVVASAGPWRTVAEWWTDAPVAIDSYDLEIAGGLLLRASRELSSGSWWIEAVYD